MNKISSWAPQWVLDVLDPEKRVIFINVDNIVMKEVVNTKDDNLKSNDSNHTIVFGKSGSNILQSQEKKIASIEKELIVFLVKALLLSGLGKNQLVILAIYNLFKNKLEKKLKVNYIYIRF